MATRAPKPCRRSGCSVLIYDDSGFCQRHADLAEKEWVKAPGQSGRGGRPWRRKRDRVLQRDGYLCQCDDCKVRLVPLVAHEVDHIVPISQGGTDDEGNLQAMNRDCHRAKSQREAGRSRRGRGGSKL